MVNLEEMLVIMLLLLMVFKKLEYLDKDKLLGITKSIITDLLGNLTEEEKNNYRVKYIEFLMSLTDDLILSDGHYFQNK